MQPRTTTPRARPRAGASPALLLPALAAALGLALLAPGCASTSPAGPAERPQAEKREKHRVTGSHIPREEPIPEHGLAPAPFRAEVITRDEIRQSGAMTTIEALQRH